MYSISNAVGVSSKISFSVADAVNHFESWFSISAELHHGWTKEMTRAQARTLFLNGGWSAVRGYFNELCSASEYDLGMGPPHAETKHTTGTGRLTVAVTENGGVVGSVNRPNGKLIEFELSSDGELIKLEKVGTEGVWLRHLSPISSLAGALGNPNSKWMLSELVERHHRFPNSIFQIDGEVVEAHHALQWANDEKIKITEKDGFTPVTVDEIKSVCVELDSQLWEECQLQHKKLVAVNHEYNSEGEVEWDYTLGAKLDSGSKAFTTPSIEVSSIGNNGELVYSEKKPGYISNAHFVIMFHPTEGEEMAEGEVLGDGYPVAELSLDELESLLRSPDWDMRYINQVQPGGYCIQTVYKTSTGYQDLCQFPKPWYYNEKRNTRIIL